MELSQVIYDIFDSLILVCEYGEANMCIECREFVFSELKELSTYLQKNTTLDIHEIQHLPDKIIIHIYENNRS